MRIWILSATKKSCLASEISIQDHTLIYNPPASLEDMSWGAGIGEDHASQCNHQMEFNIWHVRFCSQVLGGNWANDLRVQEQPLTVWVDRGWGWLSGSWVTHWRYMWLVTSQILIMITSMTSMTQQILKDATLFFLCGGSNLPMVIPAMDHINMYFTNTIKPSTIEGHLLSHPRYLATSIFKDQSVRKLRKLVLRSLDNRSGKWCTKCHSLTMMPHWIMMQSTRAVVCLGIFAKELAWPDMVITAIWHRSFSPLPQNEFYPYIRPTT